MSIRMIQRFLVLGLLGAGGILLAADLLFSSAKTAAPAPAMALSYTIIRAASPVSRGSLIQPRDLVAVSSADPPAAGLVTSMADASGRVATQDIARAEPLSNANTSVSSGASGLAQLIPQGMRAVAVRVTDELAVANLIRPGDCVDVLVISNGVKAARGEETPFPSAEVRTILQNVRVLAVGETIVGNATNGKDYRNVTLAVTPKEAGMIALARTVGTQYLSLRAADDVSETREPWSLTTDDLHFSGLPKQNGPAQDRPDGAQAAGDPASRMVEVISGAGNQRQTVAVPRVGEP